MALNRIMSFAQAILVDRSSCEAEAKGEIIETEMNGGGFQMPLHYPRYGKSDYEKMEEWKVDNLLREYGMVGFRGSLDEKRKFAMGAFLWPDQY